VVVEGLTHRYGARAALDNVSFAVATGEFFGLLGPNGGGKTTLFRVLSTLVTPQQGRVRMFDADLARQRDAVRPRIGVVFQAPGLDRKLTVAENLRHQGHLYNLSGQRLRARTAELLERFGLTARARDLVETLSGGLRRRVELAKGLLHRPELLLLDEPSTGLDPRARREFGEHLEQLRRSDRLTVVLTTHIMEEADRCDRVAILDHGRLVALDSPARLKEQIGGDVISIQARQAEPLRGRIEAEFGVTATMLDGVIRIQRPRGHEWITKLVEAFPGRIDAISVGKPTLEDVFIERTGHRFEEPET
jgi:ABC-2 type transport system ATP-binding protein